MNEILLSKVKEFRENNVDALISVDFYAYPTLLRIHVSDIENGTNIMTEEEFKHMQSLEVLIAGKTVLDEYLTVVDPIFIKALLVELEESPDETPALDYFNKDYIKYLDENLKRWQKNLNKKRLSNYKGRAER